jgi:hypothetical protein
MKIGSTQLSLFFITSYPHAFLRDYNFTYFCMTSWNFPSFGFQQVTKAYGATEFSKVANEARAGGSGRSSWVADGLLFSGQDS